MDQTLAEFEQCVDTGVSNFESAIGLDRRATKKRKEFAKKIDALAREIRKEFSPKGMWS